MAATTSPLQTFRARMRRAALQALGSVGLESRGLQLSDEVAFWRKWLKTGGLEWPEDYAERMDPELWLQDHVARYACRLPGETAAILDVGAGPLTKLGKILPGKRLEITATDLLAPEYDKLLAEFSIEPLVRTIHGDAEALTSQFGENSFDIVHGQNSVDHTSDPIGVIRQMVAVTRPGGYTILLHAENEGKNEGYTQLHKWDFTCEDRHFIIRGPGANGPRVDITDLLSAVATVECEFYDGWVLAAARKRHRSTVK